MEPNPQQPEIDPALARAQKSMGSRRDPDDEPVVAQPEPDVPPEPPIEPDAPVVPDEPPTPPVEPPVAPDGTQPPADEPPVNRPAAYIPLKKYHDEKTEWSNKAETAEQRAVIAEARVKELEGIASTQNGADKDKDIEEFMALTGFDRETVDGFLTLAEKRFSKGESMSPEERAAVAKATDIVREAELESAFNTEFTTYGEPEIIKAFPDAKPEQILKAKEELDKIAHTAENKDKPLDFLIYKNKETLAPLFAAAPEPVPPATRRTVESSRIGNGRATTLTAADFSGNDADFSLLGDMEASERSKIIQKMDARTYSKFIQYAKDNSNDGGVVVTRGGRKVILK